MAIELGKDDPDALSRAAFALGFLTGDLATGFRAVDRAVALNPNAAHAWSTRGWILVWTEQPEQAAECFGKAMLEAPCQAEVSAAFIPQWNERRHVAGVR